MAVFLRFPQRVSKSLAWSNGWAPNCKVVRVNTGWVAVNHRPSCPKDLPSLRFLRQGLLPAWGETAKAGSRPQDQGSVPVVRREVLKPTFGNHCSPSVILKPHFHGYPCA
jgi:hypothetical protein